MNTHSTIRLTARRGPALLGFVLLATLQTASARNVILFVADGLRPAAVNAQDAPTLTGLRDRGVYFSNSHSVFPTVTMANAAAIATGHQPGDTGIYSNSPWVGYNSFNAGNFQRPLGSITPFIENDLVLGDLADHYGGNPLGDRTLLSLARGAGYSTAAIGKLGPVALQDPSQIAPSGGSFITPQTIILDDATAADGVPLAADVAAALRDARMAAITTPRLQPQGDMSHGGTHNANWGQQVYFVDAATRAVLPLLGRRGRPFVLVYWSRDPDGTQHNQGDSLNRLWPGINGDTTRLAVRNADHNLRLLLDWLDSDPKTAADTDVIVTSDHGFATISKQSVDAAGHATQSRSAAGRYADVPAGFLPPGFLANDLALHLDKPLFDADTITRNEQGNPVYLKIDPLTQHPALGDGLLGGDGQVLAAGVTAEVIVTTNGGSDSIYVPSGNVALVRDIVTFLAGCDYTASIFVDDRYGAVPGALPMSAINLVGHGKLPRPSIIVSFRSFALTPDQAGNTADPLLRTVQIADATQQQGQGQHGGFGRESTFNFMLAAGPDFRAGVVDRLPVGNADLASTIARVLGLTLPDSGSLPGRVLGEALRTGAVPSGLEVCLAMSAATADGRRTILQYQLLERRRYADRAEFRVPLKTESTGCRVQSVDRAVTGLH